MWLEILYDDSDVSSHDIPEMVRYEDDPIEVRIDGGELYIGYIPQYWDYDDVIEHRWASE